MKTLASRTQHLLFLSCLALAGAQGPSSIPTIDLGYVKYTGYQNATAGINYYRGIRYVCHNDLVLL
jgi:hypothetical protein